MSLHRSRTGPFIAETASSIALCPALGRQSRGEDYSPPALAAPLACSPRHAALWPSRARCLPVRHTRSRAPGTAARVTWTLAPPV